MNLYKALKGSLTPVRIQLNVLIFIVIVFNIDYCTPKREGKTEDIVTNSQIYRKKKMATGMLLFVSRKVKRY